MKVEPSGLGLVPLWKRTWNIPCPSTVWGHSKKAHETWPCWHLDLACPRPQSCEKCISVICKPPVCSYSYRSLNGRRYPDTIGLCLSLSLLSLTLPAYLDQVPLQSLPGRWPRTPLGSYLTLPTKYSQNPPPWGKWRDVPQLDCFNFQKYISYTSSIYIFIWYMKIGLYLIQCFISRI